MVFFFTEKQQAEGINRVIIELFPKRAAYSTFQNPGKPFFFFFFWNVKYDCNEHSVFHRRQLVSRSLFWKAHPFLFPCSAGSRVCSAAQTEHPPAQRHPCSSPILEPPLHLHSCWGRAEPWPCHNGVNINWFAQEQTAREQQLPEEAGCAPATHSQDTRLQDLSVPGEAVTKGRPLCPAFLHDFRGATCFY